RRSVVFVITGRALGMQPECRAIYNVTPPRERAKENVEVTHRAARDVAPWPIALFAYTALAALVTWPLVLRLTSVVPHDLGDPLLSTWILWWNAHAVPLTAHWWNA